MIHLDANLLIAASDPTNAHAASARRIQATGKILAASACAWTEFRSKPVSPQTEKLLRRVLSGGILPFDESAADLAGELFRLTGANRRTRLDSMIAATAILAGAELATVNTEDFRGFVIHGLNLHPLLP